MEKSFSILTDTSSDLSDELIKSYDISLVSFYVSFDKVNYIQERIDMTVDEFYTYMDQSKIIPKTSLPSIQDYIDKIQPELDKGRDVMVFTITSVFSGSYQSAMSAKEILTLQYPDRSIEIIDSMQATSGQGLLVLEAAKMREDGLSFKQTVDNILRLRHLVKVQIGVDNLDHIVKGGRIFKLKGLLGQLLQVKCMIVMENGELHPLGVCRSHKKTVKKLIDYTEKDLANIPLDHFRFVYTKGTAELKKQQLREEAKHRLSVAQDYPDLQAGMCTGTHIGPSAYSIAYIAKYTHMDMVEKYWINDSPIKKAL